MTEFRVKAYKIEPMTWSKKEGYIKRLVS